MSWFLFSEKFFYLVTQKISYCKIICQSRKRCSFFKYKGKCVLIFLNTQSVLLVQTLFSSMLVENGYNLSIAKMFCMQLSLKNIFGDLRFNLLCYIYIFFCFILSFFYLRRWIEIFLVVLRSKSMFCEHYLLPQVKNIGTIKRYFNTFPVQDCIVVFDLISLFLKSLLVLNDLLKSTFERK